MGVGLRPEVKTLDKPPNPKASDSMMRYGRSDLNGKQNWRPEHKGMIAAPIGCPY
jgi:hypothetical protein